MTAHRLSASALVCAWALALAACSFHPVVPNAKVACNVDKDCPQGLQCVPLVGSMPPVKVCCLGSQCVSDAPGDASAPGDAITADAPTALEGGHDGSGEGDRPIVTKKDDGPAADRRSSDAPTTVDAVGFFDAVALPDAVAPPDAGPDPVPPLGPPGGVYQLGVRHSGKCMSTDGTDKDDALVMQFDCVKEADQLFRFDPLSGDKYHLVNLASEKCLNGDPKGADTGLVQYTCGLATEDSFRVAAVGGGYYQIMLDASRLCLEVENASADDAARVRQAPCANSPAQQWRLSRRFYDPTVSLVAKHSNKCLYVGASGIPTEQNPYRWAPIYQSTCNVDAGSLFTLQDRNDGTFSLATSTGNCTDVEMSSFADGAEVRQWMCNGTSAQLFRIESMGGGHDRVVNVNSNKCLEVVGSGLGDGAEVVQSRCTGKDNQLFRITTM